MNADEIKEMKKRAAKALKSIQKNTGYASFIKDAKLVNVGSWIDTGNLVLNGIISGSLYGGIADNKVTLLAGESTTGKTLLAAKIAGNAQKKDGKVIIWVDSEFAATVGTAVSFGIDPEAMIHMPIKSVEECRNVLIQFLQQVEADKEQGKYMIVIDSLANMVSAMDNKRIEKDSESGDMGSKAKAMGSLLQNLNIWSGFTSTPVLCTNHVYENPGDPFAKFNPVKLQPGGKKVMYIPSSSIQLTKTNADEDDAKNELGGGKLVAGQNKFLGQYITALVIKNRFVKPNLKVKMYLSHDSGLHKYAGLIELAMEMDIIQKVEGRNVYHIPAIGKEIGMRSKFVKNPDVYKSIIPLIEEKIKVLWAYSPEADDDMSLDTAVGDDTEESEGEDE